MNYIKNIGGVMQKDKFLLFFDDCFADFLKSID